MKKRITSLLLVLAMCFAMLPTAAFAADDEGSEIPAYSGGSGTQDNPWLISSVEDLQLLANTINNGKAAGFDADAAAGGEGVAGNYYGYYFKQTTDLDLSSIESWDPIGYSLGKSRYFAGQYDGGGHTISNATSTGKNDDEGYATAGIFGWVLLGLVENLRVDHANFTATGVNNGGWGGYSYAGGIAAAAFVATIKNCTVTNSAITSERLDKDGNADQNNCAGGFAGYSAGAQFVNCSSISNQITSQCYGGGFVGENDDDNEIEEDTPIAPSTYRNCFVANCSVNATTPDSQGTSFAGGFIGMIVSDIALTNCYAYKSVLSTEGTSANNVAAGVFAASYFDNNGYTASINTTNCYYGECAVTTNVGSATEKTSKEFTDGTVANALGDVFVQGKLYPVFATDPADYTAVDAAIAKANTLNKDNYKDFSAVEGAVNAVARGKNITEQAEVDAMAKDIEDAIVALQYKDADYTKVDEALAKVNTLNKDSYQDFSAVEKAVADVVRDKNITEQSKVDAMAKAIEDAIAGLVARPSSSGSSSSGSSKPSYSVTAPGTTENGSVTVSPKNATKGSTVTVTVKPDDGYQLDKLTVADAKGGTISVTDKGNGKYTFTMPASKVTVTPIFVKIAQQPTEKAFVDVEKSDWFADAVAYVTDKGLMNGTGSNTFSPNVSTTRGMLMTVIARYAGEDTSGSTPWYQKGMNWAKANGVSDGTNPEVNITREQLVTMLYRYAGSPKADGKLDSFSDAASVCTYAVNAMQWAVANGIVNGSNGKLNPKNNATRAEVAAILMRFCEMGK